MLYNRKIQSTKIIRLLEDFNFHSLWYKSLNIYPTDFCNRGCVFCKLKEILATKEKSKEMSMRDIDKIINFCKRSEIDKIRILGGEPSHHSRIVDLIERIYEKGLHVEVIFTNGLFENDKLIKCILKHRIVVNLNYFSPDEYSDGQLKLVHENMKQLFYKNTKTLGRNRLKPVNNTLSITFYRPDQDYKYLIDACLKYNIDSVRWAISERSITGKNIYVPWSKLKQMVPLLVSFVRDLITVGISNCIECSLVVPCILTKKELNFFSKFTDYFMPFKCYPGLDVFPDLSVHYCMGMPIMNWITDNNNLKQIFLDQMIISEHFRRIPRSKTCLKCDWWIEKACQGYCLQFKYDKNDSRHKELLIGLDWFNNRTQERK